MGRAINVNIQTAHNWLRNCSLPDWRVDAVKRLAEQRGIDLDAMRQHEAAARKERKARLAKKRKACKTSPKKRRAA